MKVKQLSIAYTLLAVFIILVVINIIQPEEIEEPLEAVRETYEIFGNETAEIREVITSEALNLTGLQQEEEVSDNES